jgi:hypothetical protein
MCCILEFFFTKFLIFSRMFLGERPGSVKLELLSILLLISFMLNSVKVSSCTILDSISISASVQNFRPRTLADVVADAGGFGGFGD